MKKFAFLLFLSGLVLWGCEDDKTGGETTNQNPECKITEPGAGEWKMGRDMTIKGEGSDPDGEIKAVTLTVGGKKIEQVGSVPFTYTVPGDELIAGEMVIKLEVEDDMGAKASDEVKMKVVANLSPVCEITEPEDRARIIREDGLTIKGNGSDADGKLVAITLTVNETKTTFDKMPFEHRIEPENLTSGQHKIVLEVEDNEGAVGRSEINITVADNVAPTCRIVTPADNARISADASFTISAEGEDPDGEIQRVTLKVGSETISSVTSLPIDHRVDASSFPTGKLTISLEVEDNYGAIGKDMVEVEIVQLEADQMVDPRDGTSYRTVTIGTQVWMAENLAWLPEVYPGSVTATDTETKDKPLYYVYDYDGTDVAAAKATNNYKTYGVLYNWYAATGLTPNTAADRDAVPSGVQGACPDGWHLPSKGEWSILVGYIKENIEPTECYDYDWEDQKYTYYDYNISGALRSVDLWEPYSDPGTPGLGAGTDQFGFNARPGGGRLDNSGPNFFYLYQQCNFFATDYQETRGGGVVSPSRVTYDVSAAFASPERGYSVRCLKD